MRKRMQKTLARNKTKITEIDITRRELLEKTKEEFDSSTCNLKPLLDRIKETDNLIDQIVYKLYGLTEDERKVVEGTPNKRISPRNLRIDLRCFSALFSV